LILLPKKAALIIKSFLLAKKETVMKKAFIALFSFAAIAQAIEPTSDLLKPAPAKEAISYFMVGAAAPIRQDAIDAITPNLSYGMRNFSGIHAKDYFLSAQINQQRQTIVGQYSFLFFPITTKGFAKTHSSLYIGAGLSGGVSYLSRSSAQSLRDLENRFKIKRRVKEERVTDPARIAAITEEVEKNQSLRRIAPVLDIPLTAGYQFANKNFVQLQFSTIAYVVTRIYDLPGNGIYAELNYGFGF
jgi:hypothetical protein